MSDREKQKRYARGDTCPRCRKARLVLGGVITTPKSSGQVVVCRYCAMDFPIDVKRTERRVLSERIAHRLFTGGNDRVARRLVLEVSEDGRDMGGWCEGAVADVIFDMLEEADQP